MINLIGGYVFTLLLIGIFFKRPSPKKINQFLEDLPLSLKATNVFFLLLLGLEETLKLGIPVISLFNYVIDTFILIVHEAGHFYFWWADRFTMHAGGTLFEFGLPLILALLFAKLSYLRLAAYFTYLAGHSAVGVAGYAADAREKALPLLGASDSKGHDWAYMLEAIGILEYDQTVGASFTVIGSLLMALAITFLVKDCLDGLNAFENL